MGQQLIIRWSVQRPQESTSEREIEREREQDRVRAKIKSASELVGYSPMSD